MKDPTHVNYRNLRLKIIDWAFGGYPIVKCPFCHKELNLDGIQQHIFMLARKEPFENMMGIKKGLAHANYYKKNTEISKVVYYDRVWKKSQ